MLNTTNTADGDGSKLISVDELAKRWACSRPTVSRQLEKAGIAAVFIGRLRRYRAADVAKFESDSSGPPAEQKRKPRVSRPAAPD